MNPHDTHPIEHAAAAAEAVRWLNHTTLRGGYQWPSDVDAVIGQLQTLAERMPQALTQASHWLHQQHRTGRVGLDQPATGDVVDLAVGGALSGLHLAAVRAGALADALLDARRLTNRMTGVEP
jgi:hypothetical protein